MTDAAPTIPWADGRLRRPSRGGPRILFAQMHEDAGVERAALATLPERARVFAIASGGCTALSLLSAAPRSVHAVDINPAQAHLVELKRALVLSVPTEALQQAMDGDATPAYASVRGALPSSSRTFWDDHPRLLQHGLEHCGDVDLAFARLRRLMWLVLPRRGRRIATLRLSDPASQTRAFAREWNTWRWRAGCRVMLSRIVLRRVYGAAFVDAVPDDAASDIMARVAEAFGRGPLVSNGYLWQIFAGQPAPGASGRPFYQRLEVAAATRACARRLHVHTADAATWLEQQPAGSIDFFALSNILEGAGRPYADRLIGALAHAAAPGAIVVIRAIFGLAADVRAQLVVRLGAPAEDLGAMAKGDRSPLCRATLLLRRTTKGAE